MSLPKSILKNRVDESLDHEIVLVHELLTHQGLSLSRLVDEDVTRIPIVSCWDRYILFNRIHRVHNSP